MEFHIEAERVLRQHRLDHNAHCPEQSAPDGPAKQGCWRPTGPPDPQSVHLIRHRCGCRSRAPQKHEKSGLGWINRAPLRPRPLASNLQEEPFLAPHSRVSAESATHFIQPILALSLEVGPMVDTSPSVFRTQQISHQCSGPSARSETRCVDVTGFSSRGRERSVQGL